MTRTVSVKQEGLDLEKATQSVIQFYNTKHVRFVTFETTDGYTYTIFFSIKEL